MSDETFHTRLRAAIEARGITVTAVASHLQVHRSTVNRWLKSQMPDDEQISRLAAYLNVSTSHLLTGAEIDHEHMMECQKLFALSTELNTRQVRLVVQLVQEMIETKVSQKSTD
ncbi:helix-turn-helix domain-containing protein [Chromobacterium violaceum]|uniref:helix-turn-helix domain-containing protein n=1 Tax=Chromobacterium violaceum TaxID=536 RepID=UPI0009B8AA51|nr:helix-turn-helix transcriptional regulator [Chromobacterium violaceum]